ncbi:ETX/MTX2 family pore-forming toxin Cry15Aa, partial [Bacillus thuringiensis]|nr:ETX/MTX2 family pore-forming toxin Cry15Aa [Bacillus thuringiensis]
MAIMNDIAQDAARAWDIIAGPFIRPGTTPTNRQLFNYQIGNIEVEPGNLNFSVVPELDFSVSQDLFNNTSVQQSQTASFNESRTETTSTAVTHGVKSGVTVSASAKFNAKILVKSIEQTITTTVSTEYNFSSTTTRTNTVTRGWSIAQPVLVPPHSRVTATLQIYKGDFTVPVLLSLRVYGQTGTLAGNPSFPSLYAATYENTLLGRIREHIAPPALFRASNAYISNGVQAIWRGTA